MQLLQSLTKHEKYAATWDLLGNRVTVNLIRGWGGELLVFLTDYGWKRNSGTREDYRGKLALAVVLMRWSGSGGEVQYHRNRDGRCGETMLLGGP